MIKSALIDARNVAQLLPIVLREMQASDVIGFDIETEDENRHDGLNLYNNATRHVFDHRRTNITGFSIYCEGGEVAYYFNMHHADVANRLTPDIARQIVQAFGESIVVCHNAPFELCMTAQCWGVRLKNVVCTLQMAVSHHGPDEYDLSKFYETPLPVAFHKFVKDIVTQYTQFTPGGGMTDAQQELLSKFIAKESKAEHSYNGFVKSIAKGYNLKALTKNKFGYAQATYQDTLKTHGATHMGDLTGEQVTAYGADDAYWAVRHFRWMFDEMMKTNPKALRTFFEQENPMIYAYAENWERGIRLDLDAVFEQRDNEREAMAKLLREFKARVRNALPFSDDPHPKLLEREKWYREKDGWIKQRAKIVEWANSADSTDDFTQCFQVSNPIGNGWAQEKHIAVPKGKLNIVYYMAMRTIMYDLLRVPVQYDDGSVASDKEARGRIREKLDEEGLAYAVMKDLQLMSEIEQRMKLYLTPYTQLMDPETSRVYPSLSSQLATRRLAMSFPNAMQLAKGGDSAYIRGFYLGDDDDYVVVSADWSAIELVLIGDQSEDEGFRKVYGQIPYGDMHSGAAVDALCVKTLPGLTEDEFREFKFGRNPNGRVLRNFAGVDLSPSDYHKFARGTAVGKGVNFSYWYSGALSTVANNLSLSDAEHWELVDNYRARFPLAEAWRVGVQEQAALNGFITLPDGHTRTRFEATNVWTLGMRQKFADITAAPALLAYADTALRRIQARAKNQCVNAMIQGTCATLAKRSYINLEKLCREAGLTWGVDVRLMMPIHDELVWSVHKSVVMQFLPLLRQAMTTHPDIVKTLPLHCTVAIGRSFRPFNKKDPKFTQIELDEAQFIDGVIPKELEGQVLSDDKVEELLSWMFA